MRNSRFAILFIIKTVKIRARAGIIKSTFRYLWDHYWADPARPFIIELKLGVLYSTNSTRLVSPMANKVRGHVRKCGVRIEKNLLIIASVGHAMLHIVHFAQL